MRKVWKIQKNDKTLVIDIAWDVLVSGGGAIRVNGELIDTWNVGVKFPGVTRSFSVNNLSCKTVQGWFTFKLFIDGEMQEAAATHQGGVPLGAKIWLVVLVLLTLAATVVAFFILRY